MAASTGNHAGEYRCLQSLRAVYARNLKPPGQELLNPFFSIHSPDDQLVYTSEVSFQTLNPTWLNLSAGRFAKGAWVDTPRFSVKVSSRNIPLGGTSFQDQVLVEDNIHALDLVPLGSSQLTVLTTTPPNALIFEFQDGLYASVEVAVAIDQGACLDAGPAAGPATRVELTDRIKSLYKLEEMQKKLADMREETGRCRKDLSDKLVARAELLSKQRQHEIQLGRVCRAKEVLEKVKREREQQTAGLQTLWSAMRPRSTRLVENLARLKHLKAVTEVNKKKLEEEKERRKRVSFALHARQWQLISELAAVYPIEVPSDGKVMRIVGLPLPNADFSGIDDEVAQAALGHVCHLVSVLARYLNVRLRYPITAMGSRSVIRDDFSPYQQPEFALYHRTTSPQRFEYALFLLSKNVEHLSYSIGLPLQSIKDILPNVRNIFESESISWCCAFEVPTLSFAAASGNVKLVQKIIESRNRGLSFENLIDAAGNTPLHYAVAYGQVVCVKTLIQRKVVDVSARNYSMMTALDIARRLQNVHDVSDSFAIRSELQSVQKTTAAKLNSRLASTSPIPSPVKTTPKLSPLTIRGSPPPLSMQTPRVAPAESSEDDAGATGPEATAGPRSKFGWEINRDDVQDLGLKIGETRYWKLFKVVWNCRLCIMRVPQRENFEDMKMQAQMLASVRDEHVVEFLGASLEPGRMCIITDYMPYTLADLLSANVTEPLRPETLMQIGKDIAAGMCALLSAPKKPLLHGRLKPSNLLVSHAGRIKIADYAQLWILKDEECADEIFSHSNMRYAAPELLGARLYTQKMDVFSFGTLMWELCAVGRDSVTLDSTKIHPASYGMSVMVGRRIAGHMSEAGFRVTEKMPVGIPHELIGLIKSCWLTDPTKRPSFFEIQDVLGFISTSTKRVGVPARGQFWSDHVETDCHRAVVTLMFQSASAAPTLHGHFPFLKTVGPFLVSIVDGLTDTECKLVSVQANRKLMDYFGTQVDVDLPAAAAFKIYNCAVAKDVRLKSQDIMAVGVEGWTTIGIVPAPPARTAASDNQQGMGVAAPTQRKSGGSKTRAVAFTPEGSSPAPVNLSSTEILFASSRQSDSTSRLSGISNASSNSLASSHTAASGASGKDVDALLQTKMTEDGSGAWTPKSDTGMIETALDVIEAAAPREDSTHVVQETVEEPEPSVPCLEESMPSEPVADDRRTMSFDRISPPPSVRTSPEVTDEATNGGPGPAKQDNWMNDITPAPTVESNGMENGATAEPSGAEAAAAPNDEGVDDGMFVQKIKPSFFKKRIRPRGQSGQDEPVPSSFMPTQSSLARSRSKSPPGRNRTKSPPPNRAPFRPGGVAPPPKNASARTPGRSSPERAQRGMRSAAVGADPAVQEGIRPSSLRARSPPKGMSARAASPPKGESTGDGTSRRGSVKDMARMWEKRQSQ